MKYIYIINISVTIIVGEIVSGGSCDDYCSDWPSFSYGEYGTLVEWTQVSGDLDNLLVTNVGISLSFESVLVLTFEYLFSYYDVDGYGYSSNCDVELELDQLPCNPCRDTTDDTLARIITWVRIQLFYASRTDPLKIIL